MKLRGYQETFVSRSLEALKTHLGVLGIAATGAGKTVCLSSVAKEFKRVLILQHQTELLQQNSKTFSWVCPERKIGFIDQSHAEFDHDVTFAMRQTLVNHIADIKPYDLIIIDESHHSTCSQYKAIIERLRELNPQTKLFGVTATPERADKADLSQFYEVISDKINIDNLIRMGYLVPPKAFVIKVAEQDILKNQKNTDEQIESVLNTAVTNKRVIEEWKARASDRRTLIFCQTVSHAIDVAKAFESEGVTASYVDGSMKPRERKRRLKDFETGKIQVMCNATLLTEGYDNQAISCVILLRARSSKSSLIQMVGRGLRKLDPDRFPDVAKSDCLVLDFGVSLIIHGDLDSGDRLSFKQDNYEQEIADVLQCPVCGAPIEPRQKQCLTCLHIIERDENGRPVKQNNPGNANFEMTELEIFKAARFRYAQFGEHILFCHGWSAWAAIIEHVDGLFYVVAAKHKCKARLIGCTTNKIEAIVTSDDFVSMHGDPDISGKQNEWINERATPSQLQHIPLQYHKIPMSKYQASCLMILSNKDRWNRVKSAIGEHYEKTGKRIIEGQTACGKARENDA